MLQPLDTLDEEALLRLLADEYGVHGKPLDFAPVGEDSWCYRVGDLWVSARRDLRGHVPAAYAGAASLRAAGLDFVLAPLAGARGNVVHLVGGVPVVVFPFIEAEPLGEMAASAAEVEAAIALLGRLHRSRLPLDLPRETFDLSFSAEVEAALAVPRGTAPDAGPFGPRLHRLLTRHLGYLTGLRDEAACLGRRCRESAGPPVLTHGEPLAANLLRTPRGLMIADWGDLGWGPPERDWSHVLRTLGGEPPAMRSEVLRFYEVRWILSEVAEYAEVFRHPHGGGPDEAAMWERLTRYLPEEP